MLGDHGQSTVEAAVLLPSLLTLLMVLAQPVCLLYTRSVMWEAAAETARSVACAKDLEACRGYALRRLDAVPEVSIFHVGGREGWEVGVSRSSDQRTSTVEIAGHLRPLPLFGGLSCAFLEHDAEGVVVRVSLTEQTRPEWTAGTYDSWMQMWG